MNLREVGEDRLIAQLVARLAHSREVVAGAGDDCAVVKSGRPNEWSLLKTDCVVEGVHFLPNEKPARVGWKAMMRTLSDFAAMSGRPQFALVTLIVSPARELQWIRQLYRGLTRAAARFGVAIVGGETSSTPGPLIVSISALGSVEKARCVFRHGGQEGDEFFVTGKLGGSSKSRHLDFVPRIEEARWLTQHVRVHAMMDLSDGLGADLPRLAKASGLSFELDQAALPRTRGCTLAQAINDGEDYELLFAVAPNESASLQKKWRKKFPRLPLTRIGRLTRHPSLVTHHFLHGYQHFR